MKEYKNRSEVEEQYKWDLSVVFGSGGGGGVEGGGWGGWFVGWVDILGHLPA